MPESGFNFFEGGEDQQHHHFNHSNPLDRLLSPQERLAILETKFDQISSDNAIIKEKLEELLQLKHKGMGAVWLVSLIIGTGLLGLLSSVVGFINKGHL